MACVRFWQCTLFVHTSKVTKEPVLNINIIFYHTFNVITISDNLNYIDYYSILKSLLI